MSQTLFVIFILGLALSATLPWAAGGSRRPAKMVAGCLMLLLMVGLVLAGSLFLRGNTLDLDYSNHLPFAFAFSIDRLSAFFLLMISGISIFAVVASRSYADHYSAMRWKWYWCLLPLFILSMVVVVVAATIFAFMLGWELMTLLSAGLILVEGDSEERRRTLFLYLAMMHVGAAAVFASFLLFVPHAPTLTFAAMRSTGATFSPYLRSVIFVLSFVGFGMKAGVVPLHFWLPKAHAIAPSPVSALMSAVMLKTAVYGSIRLIFDLLGGSQSWWGYLVLGAGVVSAVLGILYALSEHTLKRLLAYSSIENIGLIYVGLGLALVFQAKGLPTLAVLALVAALFHALNHSIFKGLLFLGSGAVYQSTKTLNMEELGGLLPRMSAVGVSLLVGCAAIAGLPLLNGFVSEWLIFKSLLNGSAVTVVPVLPLLIGAVALVGTLACACFVKLFGVTFLGRPRSPGAERPGAVPVSVGAALLVMAALCLLLGVDPGIVLPRMYSLAATLVANAAVPPELAAISGVMPMVAIGACLACLLAFSFRWTRTRRVDTWACGLPGLTQRMQYTATSFSKPLRSVFRAVYKPTRTVDIEPTDNPYFPVRISYESVRTTSFEKTLYRPTVDMIVAAARQLRRLHTGNIQAYLLYIFLMIIALLLLLRFA